MLHTRIFELFEIPKSPKVEWEAVAVDECSAVPHGTGSEEDLMQMAEMIAKMNRIRETQAADGQPIDDWTIFRRLLEVE